MNKPKPPTEHYIYQYVCPILFFIGGLELLYSWVFFLPLGLALEHVSRIVGVGLGGFLIVFSFYFAYFARRKYVKWLEKQERSK